MKKKDYECKEEKERKKCNVCATVDMDAQKTAFPHTYFSLFYFMRVYVCVQLSPNELKYSLKNEVVKFLTSFFSHNGSSALRYTGKMNEVVHFLQFFKIMFRG